MRESKILEEYFQRIAGDFDSIYSKKKNFLFRFLDLIFRKSMYERFEGVLRECQDLKGKSVLDIGCGSGRYAVEFALRGAQSVMGMDFSENMLLLARKLAEEKGVSRVCSFIKADFLDFDFKNTFNICVAIGVLEYFEKPQALLEKMISLAEQKIILSLPVLWTLRSVLRKVRLKFKGCPVYFYTAAEIKNLLERVRIKDYKITRLDRDYLVVINV